jgi:hypothetical protein
MDRILFSILATVCLLVGVAMQFPQAAPMLPASFGAEIVSHQEDAERLCSTSHIESLKMTVSSDLLDPPYFEVGWQST